MKDKVRLNFHVFKDAEETMKKMKERNGDTTLHHTFYRTINRQNIIEDYIDKGYKLQLVKDDKTIELLFL